MPKPPRPWTVTPHHAIEELEDNLWVVAGEVPGFPKGSGFNRRMHVIKLADGQLVFHNAVPLDEAAMAKLTAWGKPSILIVPQHLHGMDAHAFREKLGLKVFAPKQMFEKVRRILPVDGALEDLPKDPALQLEPLAGTKFFEAAYVVRSGPRASLVLCDAVHNSRRGSGFGGFMFRVMGFTGPEPRMPPLYKVRAVSDKEALRKDLLRLAETPGLARLLPSHGEIVTQDAAGALRKVAAAM
jgi:hypothetical protein